MRHSRSLSHRRATDPLSPSRLPATELRIEWTPEAADNLDAIVTYVELFHPPAAERLAFRLIALADSLGTFPNRGREVGEVSTNSDASLSPPSLPDPICGLQPIIG